MRLLPSHKEKPPNSLEQETQGFCHPTVISYRAQKHFRAECAQKWAAQIKCMNCKFLNEFAEPYFKKWFSEILDLIMQ